MRAATLPRAMWRPASVVAAVVVVAAVAVGVGLRGLYRADPPVGNAPAAPSISTVPPPRPDSRTVQMTYDAVTHPDAERVRSVLQTYYDSINDRDYALWKTVVTNQVVNDAPTLAAWQNDYDTTHDSEIMVYRIEQGPPGALRASVSFTSHQNPDKAPSDLKVGCIRWRLVYQLVWEDDLLKIGGSTVQRYAC